MPNRITESITEVKTDTGWSVRVWWTRASFEACFDNHNAIVSVVRNNAANAESIRAALEGMEGAATDLAAFEIRDRFGNGAVVYPDWN